MPGGAQVFSFAGFTLSSLWISLCSLVGLVGKTAFLSTQISPRFIAVNSLMQFGCHASGEVDRILL